MGASGSAIRAGQAFVELFAEDSKLVRGLRGAEGHLKAFGGKVAGIGSAILAGSTALAAPLLAAAKLFSDMGSEMIDMAGRTGASVEALSTMKFAAEQTGASVEDLETGLKKGQKAIADAAGGSKEAGAALAALGLRASELATLKPEAQFRLIAARISGIPNPTRRAAMAMQIFGKSGTKLLPMMKDLAELEERARSLGLEMSGEDASAADTLGDAWGELMSTAKMAAFQVGAALAPALTSLVEAGTRVVVWTANWFRENRELVVTIAKILAIVAGVGVGLIVLGGVISGIGMAFGVLASLATAAGTVLGVIGTVAAFLVSPIGLVITALATLGAWFFTATESGRRAISSLVDAFNGLKEDALTAFGGIRDALAAGDLGAAMAVATSFLQLEWQKAVQFLEERWFAFKDMFLGIATDAFFGVLEIWNNVSASLEGAWVSSIAFIQNAWTTMLSGIQTSMAKAQGFIAKVLLKIQSQFDKSLNLEDALAIVDEGTAGKVTGINADATSTIAGRNAARDERLKNIEQDRAAEEDRLAGANNDANQSRRDAFAGQLKSRSEAVAAAQKAFQESLDNAAAKRREAESKAADKGRSIEQQKTDGLAVGKLTTSGTFSAAATRGFGGGRLDEIATSTRETAKHTRRIAQRDGGIPVE